jgi:hypothetical protein
VITHQLVRFGNSYAEHPAAPRRAPAARSNVFDLACGPGYRLELPAWDDGGPLRHARITKVRTVWTL